MFGSTEKLDESAATIEYYKSVLNNFDNRNYIMSELVGKSGTYIGSWMVFDPEKNDELTSHYTEDGRPTTEGESYDAVRRKLTSALQEAKGYYTCFSLGAIMSTGNVSHIACYLLQRDRQEVKVLNSARHPLAQKYDTLLTQLVLEARPHSEFVRPFITKKRMCTFSPVELGPQDLARGGALDEVGRWFSYKMDVHAETYCQSWSMLMLLYELDQTGDTYNIKCNYIRSWDDDQKGLELLIRGFILWVVRRFDTLFRVDDESANSKLLRAFKTLYEEIETPDDWRSGVTLVQY